MSVRTGRFYRAALPCALILATIVLSGCPGREERQEQISQAMSRAAAIERNWEAIKDHLNGTETIEACTDGRTCYDLEADIDAGAITTVHFVNGGFLTVSADLDQDGSASDIDQRGRNWDFTLDMDTPIVNEAVQAWARETRHTIQ